MLIYRRYYQYICQQYPETAAQFKIILPDNLLGRIKEPELTINEPVYQNTFLRVNVTGSEAASAADSVTWCTA